MLANTAVAYTQSRYSKTEGFCPLVHINMSQETVLTFLKENPDKWWTSKEIAEKLNASIGSVTCNLAKLRRYKMIAYKFEENHCMWYLYKYNQ